MDVRNELQTLGFVRAGEIRPENAGRSCRAHIDHEVEGFVVFALVAEDRIRKFGSTGRKQATLKKRMQGHASALNGVMIRERAKDDPFKRLAPQVIAARQEIEVWAKESLASIFEREARELNDKHDPEWADRRR